MKLIDLAGILPVDGVLPRDVEVSGVSSDSRQVTPGTVFFAVSGSKADGAAYASDAVKRGAVAVVAAKSADLGSAGEHVEILSGIDQAVVR